MRMPQQMERPRPEVKRINFEGSRATSVLAENNFNEWVTIEARKGVILAGGAVSWHHLRMLF